MHVREIMTPNVELVGPQTSVRDAAIRMRKESVGALPVGEDDRLVGMVTDRDIVVEAVASDRNPVECSVRDVMSEGIYYCFDDDDARSAADVMAEHKVRRLPVVNRDRRLVGIVAVADLARAGIAEPAVEAVSQPASARRD